MNYLRKHHTHATPRTIELSRYSIGPDPVANDHTLDMLLDSIVQDYSPQPKEKLRPRISTALLILGLSLALLAYFCFDKLFIPDRP